MQDAAYAGLDLFRSGYCHGASSCWRCGSPRQGPPAVQPRHVSAPSPAVVSPPPSPPANQRRLAAWAAVLTVVAPPAGPLMARRVREAGIWLLLRGALLLATPLVVLDLGARAPLVWAALLLFLHVVFAARNAARGHGLVLNHTTGPVDWLLVQWAVALCVGGSLRMVAHHDPRGAGDPRDVQRHGAHAGKRQLGAPGPQGPAHCRGRRGAAPLRQRDRRLRAPHPRPGPLWTRVEPVDAQQPKAVVVPDHWVFILGDNAAHSEGSRQLGPMPPTGITARVLPL